MMIEPLPKWLMKRYALLWRKFNTNQFTQQQVSELFKEKDFKLISAILSELNRSGWIKIKRNEEDARKKEYSLVSPLESINQMYTSDNNEKD